MSIVLGPFQYGKAETRLVRIVRDTARHEITDLNVSSALRGPFAPAHLDGDQSNVLPTDTQKNTAYVWAKKVNPDPIEAYGLALAHHFVDDVEPVESRPHRDRALRLDARRDRRQARTTTPSSARARRCARPRSRSSRRATHVVQGFKDLIMLKSTGSHFKDFLVDGYTTLEPTDDRMHGDVADRAVAAHGPRRGHSTGTRCTPA